MVTGGYLAEEQFFPNSRWYCVMSRHTVPQRSSLLRLLTNLESSIGPDYDKMAFLAGMCAARQNGSYRRSDPRVSLDDVTAEIARAEDRAMKILSKRRDQVLRLASALKRFSRLNSDQLADVWRAGR
jgi:hypothetical protein